MRTEFCKYEDAVAAALLHGPLDGSLQEHAASCAHCGELPLILQYLAHIAPSGEDVQPWGSIWWRAQLAERRDRAQRAVAAIRLMQKLAMGVTFIALFAFAWFWGRDVPPSYASTLFIGAGMFLATAAVLYGWARSRI